MKTVEIEIRGVTPYLMHKFSEESEQQKTSRRVMAEYPSPREAAEKVAYKDVDGTFYFNSFAIIGALGAAGASHKMKGTRKSLRFVVPSAVRVTAEKITILNGSGPAKDFEVDSRPVTIPATKGRIMRHRPRFDCWGAKFTLLLDDNLLSEEQLHLLLSEGGTSIGIGDFRPEKKGPFGTFRVVSFKAG